MQHRQSRMILIRVGFVKQVVGFLAGWLSIDINDVVVVEARKGALSALSLSKLNQQRRSDLTSHHRTQHNNKPLNTAHVDLGGQGENLESTASQV
jgi:hypothetical protein